MEKRLILIIQIIGLVAGLIILFMGYIENNINTILFGGFLYLGSLISSNNN